jgi:hypothetical protein
MAWPRLKHNLAVRRNKESIDDNIADAPHWIVFRHHRYPENLLNHRPVNLLAVVQGYLTHSTH